MDIIEEIPTVYNRMRLLRLARQSCPSYNSVRVKNKNVEVLSFYGNLFNSTCSNYARSSYLMYSKCDILIYFQRRGLEPRNSNELTSEFSRA
jgi:hypothetical protein